MTQNQQLAYTYDRTMMFVCPKAKCHMTLVSIMRSVHDVGLSPGSLL